MEYILRENKSTGEGGGPGCILCDLAKEEDGPGNLILRRGNLAYVVMNKYPYSNGHLMVVPYRHEKDFDALSEEEGAEIFRLGQMCVALLRRALSAQGFNMGLNLGKPAGAGIDPHLHFHVIPRWEGDHNFMTVVGEVRTIPEHIQATYEGLHEAIRRDFPESPA